MATAAASNLLPGVLNEIVSNSKILVVGAGGIGCELIKNLVLTGFQNIDIVDLDTIDVSNLNRQFLFQKQHVGKSKAKVARESVLKINPSANIKAHHASITSPDYGPEYFKQFSVVLNALDNRAARSHVNRMCLASDIPLVESGSAGYYGQVTVIKKGLTECYECQPKPPQKTFPGCTIRNTPSEPIHCIVWAKHLFNQLFGEDDPDEDVSPDTADPEATGDAGAAALINNANDAGNIERISTHAWAVSCDYDANKLLHKLFHSDIKYLLSMDRLWINRRPPTPIDFENLPDAVAGPSWSDNAESGIQDQRIWSVKECAEVFKQSVHTLKERLHELTLEKKDDPVFLVWDKDDAASMDFVTACANIRAYIFDISQKSRFDVKSMAGNIIPAIATTNAIIAGLIVMETLKVLQAKYDVCRTFYLNRKPNVKNRLIVPSFLDKPNPKCVVCSPKPEIALKVNVDSFTVANFENKVLKSNLNMVAPDVMEEGKGKVLISSEEGETTENNNKNLGVLGVRNGTRLVCDDFLQTYQLIVTIIHCETLSEGLEFEVVGDITQLKATQSENGSSTSAQPNDTNEVEKSSLDVDEDYDLMIVEPYVEIAADTKKRGAEELHILSSAKKQRLE